MVQQLDSLSLALSIVLALVCFVGIAWICDKFGLNDSKPEQKQSNSNLEEEHREDYTNFFRRVVFPMMDANAESLCLESPKGLPQHEPHSGSRVGMIHGHLAFGYIFFRTYNVHGGITNLQKIYSTFPAADMRKELASHIQSFSIAGGMPCQNIFIKDVGEGRVWICFIF